MLEKKDRPALRERLYRRRFLVPNAVTLGSLFCGFLAIMYATSDRYQPAVYAIFFAALLDGIDGRVARRLNATSSFGVEFDSFADLISFGVAPAVLIYRWAFYPVADDFGILITFPYAVAAATRLARFNISPPNLTSFTGCPTPGAAALVASIVNIAPVVSQTRELIIMCSIVMPALAYLMVSRLEFVSIKALKVTSLRHFGKLLVAVFIALIWYNAKIGMLAIAGIYCFSGPFIWAKRSLFQRKSEAVTRPSTTP